MRHRRTPSTPFSAGRSRVVHHRSTRSSLTSTRRSPGSTRWSRYGALKAGARGSLLKGTAPEQLIQAIHAAVQGDALIDQGVTARLPARFSANAGSFDRSQPRQPFEPLTEREEEVLLTVARGRTNAEIGEDLHISVSTVKFHLASLMTKIAVSNRVELVMWAYDTKRVR